MGRDEEMLHFDKHFLTLLGLLAMVPSNPNGNGENSTSMMGIPTADATQDTAASSGIFYCLTPS